MHFSNDLRFAVMTDADFAALALSLSTVEEGSHFGKRDFRKGGKVFASLPSATSANLKLTPDQQMMLVEMHGGIFTAVPNAWGLKGWTTVDLTRCEPDLMLEALGKASANVAAKSGGKRRREAS
jgi:hypothetical protein